MQHGLLHELRAHPLAFGLAVALHLLVIGLLVLRLDSTTPALAPAAPERPVSIVQARAVDARQFDAAIERHRQAERRKAERRRQAELRKRRAAERKRKEAEARKRRAAEQKRQAEARKRRLAEEKRRAAEERKRREAERKAREQAEREAERRRLAEAMAAEEAELKRQEAEAEARRRAEAERARQSRLAAQRADWVARIRARVQASWRRPPGSRPGDVAHVYITQAPGGIIMAVRVASCSGSAAFCKSVEAAVLRAEPLPPPPDPALFERELHFIFAPLGG